MDKVLIMIFLIILAVVVFAGLTLVNVSKNPEMMSTIGKAVAMGV